jgi:hypothetical protein
MSNGDQVFLVGLFEEGVQLTDYRDKIRARIPLVRGLFARNEEIYALTRLCGGPGRALLLECNLGKASELARMQTCPFLNF